MPTTLEEVRKYFGTLPLDYEAFLSKPFKTEHENGTRMFTLDTLIAQNKKNKIQKKSPGIIAIGQDTFDSWIVVEAKTQSAVYCCFAGKLLADELAKLRDSVADWEAASFDMSLDDGRHFVDLELMRMPASGLRGVVQLNELLKLNLSATEISKRIKSLPACLGAKLHRRTIREHLARLKASHPDYHECLEVREGRYKVGWVNGVIRILE